MKKTLWLLAALLAICLFLFSACNEEETSPVSDTTAADTADAAVTESPETMHQHEFGSWEATTKSTCTKAGVQTRTCACGETQTAALPLADHTPADYPSVDATCAAKGSTGGAYCRVCDAHLSDVTEVPAKGHTEVIDAAIAPTCTAAGMTEGAHCSTCKAVLRAQVAVPPTHTYDGGTAHDGHITYTCTVNGCGRAYAVSAKQDYHNVKDYGAVGDGIADDTVAFHDATRAAKRDGLPVYVPAGTYHITQTISLNAVTLYGYNSGSWTADVQDLPTVLHVNLDAPLFNVNTGSLSGLNLQVQGVSAETASAAETVMVSGVGSRVNNLRIHSPYIGIKATYNNTGRSVLQDIFIVQAWKHGIDVSGTWDIATLQNIEVWNPDGNHPCPAAFRFGKNDALHASNLFTFNAVNGFEFYFDELNQGGCWGSFDNCGVDLTSTGIYVGTGDHHLTFNGGTYWGHWFGLDVTGETASTTAVTVTGAEFRFNGGNPIRINGGGMTTVTGCNVIRTMNGHAAAPIAIGGGRGVTVIGNTLSTLGSAIEIARSFKGAATVTANTILSGAAKKSAIITDDSHSAAVVNTDGNTVLLQQRFP